MSRGINKVILIGNLGRDPETRYTPSGKAVASVSLATSELRKDKEGEKQEITEWHRIVFWGRLAEIVQEYLKKGSKIYIEGRLQTRKWSDKEGQDRYTTEIIAQELQMLDRNVSNVETQIHPAMGQEGGPASKASEKSSAVVNDFIDDDIPF